MATVNCEISFRPEHYVINVDPHCAQATCGPRSAFLHTLTESTNGMSGQSTFINACIKLCGRMTQPSYLCPLNRQRIGTKIVLSSSSSYYTRCNRML